MALLKFRPVASWSDRLVFALLLALCIPAFTLFLGVVPFIGDEGIRAMVALEMQWSGDYLVPTLNGDWYGNKPPLYNWILVGVHQLFGGAGEIPSRACTLFFLSAYTLSVWYVVRRYFDRVTAFALALMLPTCGRILFWDSMVGLIDICFSWVIWLNFMALYHYGRQGRWTAMFLSSYLLMTVGYFLKGLPPLVFQALSIPIALWWHGAFRKKIISWEHIGGIVVASVFFVGYYAAYAARISLKRAFEILLDQSLQRTATHHPWSKTIGHLFAFPFEQAYHFLPWSLLVLFVFHPRFWSIVKPNGGFLAKGAKTLEHPTADFAAFNFWMLLVNLSVYWTSVEVYPRYLLMFVPLFNVSLVYVLQQVSPSRGGLWRFFQYLTIALAIVAALAFWVAPPLIERAHLLPWFYAAWLGVALLLTFAAYAVWSDPNRRLLWLAFSVLSVRIGLDVMILPFRAEDDRTSQTRSDAQRLHEKWADTYHWALLDRSEPHMVANFYLTRAAGRIVPRLPSFEGAPENTAFFVDRALYPNVQGQVLDSLMTEEGTYLYLMRK